MRFTLLLNAVPIIMAGQSKQEVDRPVKHQKDIPVVGTTTTRLGDRDDKKTDELEKDGDERTSEKDHVTSKAEDEVDVENDTATPWEQYTQGDRKDWHKYLSKPGSNGTDDGNQFDWMNYAAPYMKFNGSDTGNSSEGGSFDWQKFAGQYMGGESADNSTSTQWNNGQGDGFGEPFRSQTGGDFRYKAGRQWDNSTSGGDGGFDWQEFAAPYSNVNPSQPGTDTQASHNDSSSAMDWHKYTSGGNGGGGDFDWHQYADKYMSGGNGGEGTQQSSSNNDWQKYAAPYMGGQSSGSTSSGGNPASQVQTGAASGGYFEVEVSGTNLNVTTTFGLGQGRAANGTSDASAEAGGGGGQQTFMTADEGRIFLRGNFLNKLDPNVVPA